MTRNEAAEYFYKNMESGNIKNDIQQQVFEAAIEALEEIQKYESIGTIEKCNIYKRIAETTFSAACLDMKIIDELHEYKNIGTVKECREAREKQKPKSPVMKPETQTPHYENNIMIFCPTCNKRLRVKYEERFCCGCGQRLGRIVKKGSV